ncbi:MAG: polyphosphate kinase 2 family protein [Chloroflexi bacterium]|nr:polyphosphate kinase 2 family protein [Chloroflexota bacterium]
MAKKQRLVPNVGDAIKLTDYDPDYHGSLDKESAAAEYEELQKRLAELQEKLYAQGEKSLLVVLQAMDTGGKDGTIKAAFRDVNPQGVDVVAFKQPSAEELAHDFLWRVHKHTPVKGQIVVFNRSHYEDVLVVRVNNFVPPERWQTYYEHINAFEKLLAENGTRILKFYLHISKAEQKERLQARLDDISKHWKFATGDLKVRAQWDDYMQAYEAAIERCNTDYAPWHIVPANRKWYRNWVVTKTLVETLESMDLRYPPGEEGLDTVVIPD